MAVRTVTVRLRADVDQYTRSLRQASDRTSRLAGAGAKVGAAMLAGFAVAAAAAARFDKELSNVRAVTGATGAEMDKLRAAALEAGKTTSFTATEAARAEAELARAGISTADIVGGALKGSLALAAAGQVDLTEAAVVSAQAMNTFGLKGKDVTHIADLLAAGANKSAADVHGLAMSLRMGGLLAHQTGLSIEDTVGTLAAFADHALIGSDAGTSLKVMLQRLVPQSKEAAQMMAQIGFSAYDSKGEFVGLTELAARMKTSFSKLTPEARNAAMATIFGADAVRSATIMYELGAEGISKYVNSVNDQGAAGRMASIQTDNLIGDLERLRGAVETALIEGGTVANGSLRTMTQWITNLVNAYNDLPPGLQRTVTGFMGVGGATALAGAAFLLLIPRIAATRAALASMGVTATTVRSAMLGLGRMTNVVLGLAAVGYAVSSVADQFKEAPPSVSKLKAAMVDFAQQGKVTGEAASRFGKDLDGVGEAAARVAHPSVLKRTKDFFSTFDPFNETDLDASRNVLDAIDKSLTDLVQSGNADIAAENFNAYAEAAERSGTSTEKFRTLLPGYSESLLNAATDGKLAAEAQSKLGDEATTTADALKDQQTEAEKLSDALKTLNGMSISTAEAEISFRESLGNLSEAVKDNGHSLDVSTEKGQKIKGAFLDAAKAAMAHAEAVGEQKNSQAAGQAVLEKDIELLREQMTQAGFSKDAIEDLIGTYAKVPGDVSTDVKADTRKAVANLEEVRDKLKNTKGKTVTVDALTKEARAQLEALGFKIKNTKGKQVSITAPTGSAQSSVNALAAAIRRLSGKTVTITTIRRERAEANTLGRPAKGEGGQSVFANGGIVGAARDGLYIPGYAPRVDDQLILASRGEGVLVPEAVRKGGQLTGLGPAGFIKALNMWGRYGTRMAGFANGGVVGGLPRFASGGLLGGFSYTPTGKPVLGGPGDAKQRYDEEIADLKKAWDDLNAAIKEQKKAAADLKKAEQDLAKVRKGKHTAKQLKDAQDDVADARKEKKKADAKVSKERKDVYAADAELGLKKGAKAPTAFSLKAYETQLNESVSATNKWRSNLTRIGARGGQELKNMLEGMGEEGYALVNALAGASDKQFKSIVSKLEKTGDLAKATLRDFTTQLGASSKEQQDFAANLQKLAAQGFGDLAQALAAQGDSAAMELASQAVGSKIQAAVANQAVGKAQNVLTGDDLANSLTLLSTLRSGPNKGFADLIAAGLDVATIRALVPKMASQIKSLPAANKDTFIRQWVQQGGAAMAAGGILSRPTMVLGGEAGVKESWIPWTSTARSRALLGATAAAMGYQLVPAGRYGGGRVSAADVAREITRNTYITLNGAQQSSAEQAQDLARYLNFVG